jgi:hypothetical protein
MHFYRFNGFSEYCERHVPERRAANPRPAGDCQKNEPAGCNGKLVELDVFCNSVLVFVEWDFRQYLKPRKRRTGGADPVV